MAWRCSGNSNAELIAKLHAANIIRSPRVHQAMLSTDRAHYTASKTSAYMDSPQSIPRPAHITAHATISAPHVHAHALELMAPYIAQESHNARVLDVGCGSGYLTSCLLRLARPGTVVGIDHLPYLVETTRANVARDFGRDLTRDTQEEGEGGGEEEGGEGTGKMVLVCGDGRAGVEQYAPYDAIHVGAAAKEIPPALVAQLKSPGIMFVPVGESNGDQFVYIVEKDESGKTSSRKSHAVRYVPLTDAAYDA